METLSKKDLAIALGSAALLGLNVVVSKMGIGQFPPFMFAALRFLVCVPMLVFFPIKNISWGLLLFVSLSMGMLYLGGINLALALGVSAGVTVLFAQLSVFLIIIFGAIVFKDMPGPRQIVGISLGFVGIVCIAGARGLSANMLGMAILLFSSAAYAIGTVVIKKQRHDPLALNVWIAAVSAIPMALVSLVCEDGCMKALITATGAQWGLVLFAGWGSMLLAGAGFTYLVNRYSLNQATPFRLLTPVFGILFAVMFLAESYPLIVWTGAVLVLAGVTIAQCVPRVLSNANATTQLSK